MNSNKEDKLFAYSAIKNLIYAIGIMLSVGLSACSDSNISLLAENLKKFESGYASRPDGFMYLTRVEVFMTILDENSAQLSEKLGYLVKCMGDFSDSHVMLNNRPVSMAIVCYEGITHLVYFEGPTGWAGYIEPGADKKQIELSQAAWRDVIKSNSYSVL
jgi:hypothetical protein